MPDLHTLFQQRGYRIRKHLPEAIWTQRKLTVVDLTHEEQACLEAAGPAACQRLLAQQDAFLFPALDIESVGRSSTRTLLADHNGVCARIIVPRCVDRLRDHAQSLAAELDRRCGIQLPVLADTDVSEGDITSANTILFGGGHENRVARWLAYRSYGWADATLPGAGGVLVTTHVDVGSSGTNVVQIAGDPDALRQAVAAVLEQVRDEGGCIGVGHIHSVTLGPRTQRAMPEWPAVVESVFALMAHPLVETPLSADPVEAARQVAPGFDSGGYEKNYVNNGPLRAAIQAVRYYEVSGDVRGAVFLREVLLHFMDYYLNTAAGASIPSDVDFYLGHVVSAFARLQSLPLFSDEDCLLCANFLLACTRAVFDYNQRFWKVKPEQTTRHNHQTFPGRTLLQCADAFDRHGIPDARRWREESRLIFSGGVLERSKHSENANLYEYLTPEHAAWFCAYAGTMTVFSNGHLAGAARRAVVTTDNFFRPVDYGDAALTMKPQMCDVLPRLAAGHSDDPELQWFARNVFERSPEYILSPTLGLPPLRSERPGTPPAHGAWEKLPLDDAFWRDYVSAYPRKHVFDKLAFRSGWTDDDQYLLFEGVGNLSISHSHNEVNSIVRYNQAGRHWLVSNGYGKRVGVSNAAVAFSTRVRGPDDHNMLVLRDPGGKTLTDLPVCSVLLALGDAGPVHHLTAALLNYGGVDWYRTIVLIEDRLLLVIDRIVPGPGVTPKGHIEWNALGDLQCVDRGWQLDQQGVIMDVQSTAGWRMETGETPSADWYRVLVSGQYPYASFPPRKLVLHLPEGSAGEPILLDTAFSVRKPDEPALDVQRTAAGAFLLRGPERTPPVHAGDDACCVSTDEQGRTTIRMAAPAELPNGLRTLSAAPGGVHG